MPIAGSMDTWRNRMAGATDVVLATLDRDIEPDNALRPVISNEILRRSASQGAAVAETPIAVTPAPDAPNIPTAIPTAPTALAGVPGAPTTKPGGSGEPPSDPGTLAKRAQMAIEGGDQKTALEIYDFGLETHGDAFLQAFNAAKHDREVAAGKSGSIPTSVVSPAEGERLAHGLRSTTPPQPAPVPAAPPLPVVQPDPLVKVGSAAGLPPEPTSTGYEMRPLSGLPRTDGGKGGIMGAGGFPGSQAGRDDQEINPPGVTPPPPFSGRALPDPPEPAPYLPQGADAAVAGSLREAELATTKYRADQLARVLGPATRDARALIEAGLSPEQAITEALKQPGVAKVATADDLRRSLDLPSEQAPPRTKQSLAEGQSAGAPAPTPAPTPASPPGGGGLATLKGSTAAGTSAGVQFLDPPMAPPASDTIVPGSDRPGRRKDGSYYDPPLGPQVMPDGTVQMPDGTVRPATAEEMPPPGGRNLPRDRPMAAPPNSGGVASTVQPAVDTGTNTTTSTTTNVSAGPAVDTGTNTPQADDSGFMSKPDIWSFLTSAGLGAMASGSTSALGAIGAGGKAGIDQLGVLRKDQRERAKNLADAQFQKDRIKLGYYDTQHTDQRTDRTLSSQEKIAREGQAGADRRSDSGNQTQLQVSREGQAGANYRSDSGNRTQLEVSRQSNAGALERTERQGEIAQQLEERRAQLVLEGKDLDRRSVYDLVIEKGGTVDEAREASLGHNPVKPDKPTPMSEKDVTLTHDMVANKLFGAGVSGSVLIEKLPPEISIEYQRAVGSKQDAASAYAAGLTVLQKYGITGKPDGSWWPGSQPELTVSKTTLDPARGGGGGGGGGGAYVWDPVKKVMVPK